MKTALRIFISLAIAFPISFFGTFLLTRLYWRLEPILGVELAGHSGPSDWVFAANLVVVTLLVFVLLHLVTRALGAKSEPRA